MPVITLTSTLALIVAQLSPTCPLLHALSPSKNNQIKQSIGLYITTHIHTHTHIPSHTISSHAVIVSVTSGQLGGCGL